MRDSKKRNIRNNILNLKNRLSNSLKILFVINILFNFGCSSIKEKDDLNICSTSKLPCIHSTEYVLLETNKGKIKLELYGKLAPITVGNFIDYVDKGAYDKTIFNRVIKKPYPFIIRGGGKSLIKGENKFRINKTGKVRLIPLEIKLKTNNLPIYGKKIDASSQKNNIELKHKRAYLSMDRSKSINSGSHQFYILLKSLPELDGRFAVFGKVISGMEIVDLIEEDDFIVEAKRL